ncbi:MAG: YIP1 family protein [Bacteroidales bacterium]|jgi:hypothetical protein|nr:YIP1 family protein [Bacteroidales bacterium]
MFKEIFLTIIHLITSPQSAWRGIKKDEEDQQEFLSKFLHPIFGIIALASFIGGLWFSHNGNVEQALKNTIVNIITVYGGYLVTAYILNEISFRYNLQKQIFTFQRFTGYSSVIIYGLYIIMPFLSDFFILWLLSAYTAYIVYIGSEVFFEITKNKKKKFTLASTLLILFIPLIIKAIMNFLIK